MIHQLMKHHQFSHILCIAALGLMPASAENTRLATAHATVTAETPLQQAEAIAHGIKNSMECMVRALEKTKDEKTARIAAEVILSNTEKLQKLAKSGRDLKPKLTEMDHKALDRSVADLDMDQYKERIAKASLALADKPALGEILRPALMAFGIAYLGVAAEARQPSPIRARDKTPNVE
jgi:hypothetical protein